MSEFIEHIGIAVKSCGEAEKIFEEVFGVKVSERHRIEQEGVNVSFILLGDMRIELLEPVSKESPVASFIEKRGEGVHHIAIEVKNFDDILERLKQKYKIIGPRISTTGKRFFFIHPKDFCGILIEIVEEGYRK